MKPSEGCQARNQSLIYVSTATIIALTEPRRPEGLQSELPPESSLKLSQHSSPPAASAASSWLSVFGGPVTPAERPLLA